MPSMKQSFSLNISEVSTQRKRRPFALLLLLLAFSLPTLTHAQKMSVESLALDPSDATANLSENLIQDNNGDYAGLVKVNLAAANAEFEGLVLKSIPHGAGEYWVFMAKDSYRLRVRVSGYLPLEINFRDHGIEGIDSRRTYVLTITLPQAGVVQQDDGMRFLAMIVDPKNSTVLVDDKPQAADENGELVVRLPKGQHRYHVSAVGYETKEGVVSVGDNNDPLTVRLASTKATLRVECPTKDAEIFVNNKSKGKAPWSGSLMPGQYLVEARLKGHRTGQQSLELREKENRTVSIPALEQIVGSLSVECRPIGSEVYVDGKKVGTSPNIFRSIPIGDRSVEIRKDGYETLKKTVAIKENEQASLTGTLTAIANSASSSSPSSPSSSSSSREVFTVKGVSFTMVRVDGGTFRMGATDEQGSDAFESEKPAHDVTLSTFSIGETEVTQALWQAVMGKNPSKFKDNPEKPVECVSWDDCQEFIKKLNSLTGKSFRLPTEAEWEYAARGGSKSRKTKYSGGSDIGSVAWYDKNAYYVGKDGKRDESSPSYGTHPVKVKSPNELGLYDMSGNVYEWCADWYGSYGSSAQSNPKGPSTGSHRVNRGGGWYDSARYCRVSNRYSSTPDFRGSFLGLRLAL